jgi:hypothetical protein
MALMKGFYSPDIALPRQALTENNASFIPQSIIHFKTTLLEKEIVTVISPLHSSCRCEYIIYGLKPRSCWLIIIFSFQLFMILIEENNVFLRFGNALRKFG